MHPDEYSVFPEYSLVTTRFLIIRNVVSQLCSTHGNARREQVHIPGGRLHPKGGEMYELAVYEGERKFVILIFQSFAKYTLS